MNETAVEAISDKLAEVALLADELDKVLQTNDVIRSEDKGVEVTVSCRAIYIYSYSIYNKVQSLVVLRTVEFMKSLRRTSEKRHTYVFDNGTLSSVYCTRNCLQ